MSERQLAQSPRRVAREDVSPADPPLPAEAQQAIDIANENCERAITLAKQLSAELRKAQARVAELEQDADGLVGRLRADVKSAIDQVQASADARVERVKLEANDRVAHLEAETRQLIIRLQEELAQAREVAEQAKTEIGHVQANFDARAERLKVEADKRVARVE